MTQHLYSTAEFWGGKIFSMTGMIFPLEPGFLLTKRVFDRLGNPNDAFWLAQTLFYTHQYSQACLILTSLRQPNSSDESPRPSTSTAAPRRLTDTSLACRYLAAQCQVRLGQWEEALDMVGRGNGNILPFNGSGNEVEDATEAGDGGIKVIFPLRHPEFQLLTTPLLNTSCVAHRFDSTFERSHTSLFGSYRVGERIVHRSFDARCQVF